MRFWLLTAYLLYAAEPNRAVLTAMRQAVPDIYSIQVLRRAAASAELDLVVALGAPQNRLSAKGDTGSWDSETTLGILLQRHRQPDVVYQIALSKGEGDCQTRVERATATDVVLSCEPEKGACGPNHEFVYDIRSKALVKHIEYSPFALCRVFTSGGSAVLVGSNTQQLTAAQYDPRQQPSVQVLQGVPAHRWINQVRTNVITSGPDMKTYASIEPKPFQPVRFGPAGRFTLAEDPTVGNAARKPLIVMQHVGGRVKRYPLPQSSYNEFAKLRPLRVRDGYTREATMMSEEIGAWQIVNDVLWVAKAFYDSEGSTGIGGFGYFDTGALKYRIYSPPQIVDWSTTAMLVDSDTVWLALVHRGEYGDTSGGILRFNRTTQKVERFGLPPCDIVNEIARVGDHLLLATQSGAAMVEDHTLHRFFVDQTTTGRWQIVESTPEN